MANSQPTSLSGALWRGFRMRCPNCGQGRLFGRFLKVADHCPACGEEFSHHRADDLPAYLVILVMGHITIPALLAVELAFAPPLWLQYTFWPTFIALGALALLQPIKGAIVALQWQLGMHGFEPSKKQRDLLLQADAKPALEVTPAG